MPTVTRISPGVWSYLCECGRAMTLDMKSEERPRRLIKCWDCIKKAEPRDIILDILSEKLDSP